MNRKYVVLLGPPGAGKGTQAKILASELNLVHVSSGDIFRENIKNQTELGVSAQAFIKKGDLVPDELTISMIRERINKPDCELGVLFDGFPRTPDQAIALERMLGEIGGSVYAVPYLSVPAEVLIERLSGRWTCLMCGSVYHEKYNPPVNPGVCDNDGTDLVQRDDDKAETVKNRIEVYFKQTEPLIAYYKELGLLREIDGTQEIQAVTVDMLAAVGI